MNAPVAELRWVARRALLHFFGTPELSTLPEDGIVLSGVVVPNRAGYDRWSVNRWEYLVGLLLVVKEHVLKVVLSKTAIRRFSRVGSLCGISYWISPSWTGSQYTGVHLDVTSRRKNSV